MIADWFSNLWNIITEMFETIITSMADLLSALNTLTDDVIMATGNSNFVINSTLGAIRWIIGDTIYISIYLAITISLLYTIYILVSGIIKTINAARMNAFKLIDITKVIP